MEEIFDLENNEIFELCDEDFWEIQKYKTKTFKIQWTPLYTGWVRARVDSITDWDYLNCSNPKNAECLGLHIIRMQKQKREYADEYEYCPYYQGA